MAECKHCGECIDNRDKCSFCGSTLVKVNQCCECHCELEHGITVIEPSSVHLCGNTHRGLTPRQRHHIQG